MQEPKYHPWPLARCATPRGHAAVVIVCHRLARSPPVQTAWIHYNGYPSADISQAARWQSGVSSGDEAGFAVNGRLAKEKSCLRGMSFEWTDLTYQL